MLIRKNGLNGPSYARRPPAPDQPEERGSVWRIIFGVGAAVAAGGALYKLIQAVTDKEFKGTEFPEAFRHGLIDEHWLEYGGYCPECGRSSLRKRDLSVDHIVPIRRGGKNSRNNARVICRSCNSSKQDTVSLADKFWGRGGSRPRRRKR